jgi:hypothetical protein
METHCQTIDNEILDIREQLKRHTINFSTIQCVSMFTSLDNMSSNRSSFLSLFVTSLMNRSRSGNAGEGGGSDILGNC